MLDLDSAASVLGGRRQGSNRTFTAVGTDSRNVQPGMLFVALRGDRHDGHGFVAEALQRGAAAALVGEGFVAAPDMPLLRVGDTRRALGDLAAYWRGRFSLPLAAVTGSSGKTTVKEMLAAVLREVAPEPQVLVSQGNLNNDIGLPLTLLKLNDRHRYAVVELGMNHLGEIRALSRMAQPTVALVNNAGTAHLGYLGTVENVARAKGEIFEGLGPDGVAVINADDAFAGLWRELAAGRQVMDFGLGSGAAIRARYQLTSAGSELELLTPVGNATTRLAVPGLHNVRNALAATAAALALGVGLPAVTAGLWNFRGVKGRLQSKPCRFGGVLLDDTYNANPDSVAAAIDVLAATPGKTLLVLGDMGELGPAGMALHAQLGERARRAGIARLFGLGPLSAAAVKEFGSDGRHFNALPDLLNAMETALGSEDVVLVKGSRFMGMERVVEALESKEPTPCC